MREDQQTIQIHFILGDDLLFKRFTTKSPLVGDEIRTGGEGNEKIYRVTHRVWVYDEPICPFERLNVGIEEINTD